MASEITFVAACAKHFRREGQPLSEFSAELKKLTPKDREELSKQFEIEFGYVIK